MLNLVAWGMIQWTVVAVQHWPRLGMQVGVDTTAASGWLCLPAVQFGPICTVTSLYAFPVYYYICLRQDSLQIAQSLIVHIYWYKSCVQA